MPQTEPYTIPIRVSFLISIPENIFEKCSPQQLNDWIAYNIGSKNELHHSPISDYELRSFDTQSIEIS